MFIEHFAKTVFLEIAQAFNAYRATIVLDVIGHLGNYKRMIEASRGTGLDIDGRDTIVQFNPVNLFDRELCLRALQMTEVEVAQRLEVESST